MKNEFYFKTIGDKKVYNLSALYERKSNLEWNASKIDNVIQGLKDEILAGDINYRDRTRRVKGLFKKASLFSSYITERRKNSAIVKDYLTLNNERKKKIKQLEQKIEGIEENISNNKNVIYCTNVINDNGHGHAVYIQEMDERSACKLSAIKSNEKNFTQLQNGKKSVMQGLLYKLDKIRGAYDKILGMALKKPSEVVYPEKNHLQAGDIVKKISEKNKTLEYEYVDDSENKENLENKLNFESN